MKVVFVTISIGIPILIELYPNLSPNPPATLR